MVDFGFDAVIAGYSNPTSLQFVEGPNGEDLLITSQQDGTLTVWNVTSTGSGETKDFSAEKVFETDIVKTINNHNDDGALNTGVTNRQITGFNAVVDDNGDIQIYVTSSDPRIGGGGESNVDNKNLDTNSGVLSKVTVEVPADASVPDTGWSVDKIDLLRGIPRSEENHSVNGLDFTPEGKLLIAVGGFTNTGAPSQNLVYTPEYFLSASIIEVDVASIEAMETKTDSEGQQYKYDLPTLGIERLDHPSRDSNADGIGFSKNADNPFGGNDGYNQTYLEPGGPVSLFATGFRNTYDIEIVDLKAGDVGYVEPTVENPNPDNFRVYTWDNGANNNWGDPPVDADGNPVTAGNPDDATNHPVVEDNTPVSPGAQDQLHLVERGGYYGSPGPSRINPDTPLYLKPEIETGANNFGEVAPEFIIDPNLPATGDNVRGLWDFLPDGVDDPLNGYVPDPLEGHYLKPATGGNSPDGALVLNNGSTNGIFVFKYDPAVHPASMAEFDGDLFATGFDEQILRVEFNEDGTTALNRVDIEANNAWQTSPGANPLDVTVGPGGSIWIAAHGGNNIFAFVPEGIPIEETNNDDNDDLNDNLDPFQLDAENGLGANSKVAAGEVFEFTMETELPTPNGLQGFALGFTGHQVNYDTEFFTNASGVVKGGILEGGIAGKLQIEFDAVGTGSAVGTDNSATYALQAGVNFDDESDKIILESNMSNPWAGAAPQPGQSMGIQFGTGTQFDFAMFNFGVNASGEAEVQITIELNDVAVVTETIAAPGLLDGVDADMVMRVVIDRVNGTVTPIWQYETNSGTVTGQADPISLDTDDDPNTLNNLEEALFGAANGGFLARAKPGTPGEQGDVIFGDLNGGFGVPLGLAVGINGRVDTLGTDPSGTSFAPEFDNLLVAASDADGNFAPITEGENAGTVVLNETLTIDPADLLTNDRDLDGGTLSIVEVKDAVGGTVQLVGGQIEFTATGLTAAGFTYVVSDGTTTTEEQASVTVTPPGGEGVVLYRVNAGGPEVAAVDGGPNWEADTAGANQSQYLTSVGTDSTFTTGATDEASEILVSGESAQSNVDGTVVPEAIFFHERSDNTADANTLEYSFDVNPTGTYLINIYYTENWSGITTGGPRQFDVSVNGVIPTEFEDINPYEESASQLGVAHKRSFFVTQQGDSVLDLAFLHNNPAIQNPKVNGIEIIAVAAADTAPAASVSDAVVTEGGDMIFTVTLDKAVPNDAAEPVTITYEIVPDTAQPGVDYNVAGKTPDVNGVITGSVTVAKGSSDQSIVVQSLDNAVLDGTRGFTVTLTGVTGGEATIGDGQGVGTIQDDESPAVEPGEVVFAVNAGGGVVDGAAYGLGDVDFAADTAGSPNPSVNLVATNGGGAGNNTNSNAAGETFTGETVPDDVFVTERWSAEFGYNIDLPNGDYTVDLYFAETFIQVTGSGLTKGVGDRIFDATIEGQTVIDDIDLYDEGDGVVGNGEGAALVKTIKTFNATVVDGQLNILLDTVGGDGVDNAKVSAVVVRAAASDTDITGPAVSIDTITPPAATDAALVVEVSITDSDSAIDPATIAAGDLQLNLIGGVAASVAADSVVTNGSGGAITATFTFNAPVGGWPNGQIGLLAAPGAFADIPGNLSTGDTAGIILDIAAAQTVVGIADAGDVQETGDTLSTTLSFGMTASAGFTGDLTVNVTIDTVAEQRVVSFVAGVGTLTVDVANDDADNGPEAVSVTLDSIVETDVVVDAAAASATGTVTEDDVFDPADIDGDGTLNADDPFAYDGTNGDSKKLLPGVSFTQDFNTDTGNPFDAGFSGIIVNPAFDPPEASETDPYGDRTTEAGVSVSGGSLTVQSSETDLFSTGTGTNNTIKDNYQSAADVTGVNTFEIVAKAANPFFGEANPGSFASFGITLGAGGTDDYIKFVFGGSGGGVRVELAHESSLTGSNESILLASQASPVTPASIKDVIFTLTVDKVAGTVQGTATFLGDGGGELGSIQTTVRTIDPAGSFAAALNGQNPLTDGDGGIAYGISITDWGGAESFTGSWDSLSINALDPVPPTAPTVDAGIADQTTAEEAAFSFAVPADAFFDANGDALTLMATLVDGSPLPTWLQFDGTTFTGTPDDPNIGTITVRVTADDSITGTVFEDFDLEVTPVNDAPTIAGAVGAQAAVEGVASSIDLSALVTVDDVDVGDIATLEARLANGAGALPAGLTLNGTSLEVADTVAPGDYEIELFANDGEAESASTVTFTLSVGPPVNQPPSAVALDNLIASIRADADTTNPTKVADIDVTDDGLGTNVLGLTGDDADLFEIVGTELFLKAGAVLDFDTNPTLDVGITAQDDQGGPVVSTSLSLPVRTLPDPITIQAEDLEANAEETGNTNFFIENSNAAEGGKVIRLPFGQEGELTVDLADFGVVPGTYTLRVAYFDENDGVSTASVTVGGQTFGWTWDEDTPSNIAAITNKRFQQFEVTIPEGQTTFTLFGDSGGAEHLRVDSISLTPIDVGGGDPDNLPPQLIPGSLPDIPATQGESVSFDLNTAFVDPEETALTFQIVSGPNWLSIDTNGILSGTPEQADVTTDPVTVNLLVTDADGKSVPASFDVTVANVNDAPTVVGSVDDQPAQVGQVFSLVLPNDLFEDIDVGDVLTITVDGLPDGLTFDPTTNTISGTPLGSGTKTVTVTATDLSDASVELLFNIDVLGTGPVGDPIRIQAEDFDIVSKFFVENQTAADEGQVIRVFQNNSGEAKFDLSNLTNPVTPGNYVITVAYFDENDGTSSAEVLVDGISVGTWVFDDDGPGNAAQAGNLRIITFDAVNFAADSEIVIKGTADDGEYIRIDYIELTPTGGDSGNFGPQVADPIEDFTVDQNGDVAIDLLSTFSDPEEDPLTFSVAGPDWLSVNAAGTALVGQPPLPGDYVVTVTATDETGSGAKRAQTFTITVDAIPAEVSVADVAVNEGDGTVDVLFTRTGDPTKEITVTYSVANGTATSVQDFTPPLLLTATILAGALTGTATFAVTDDVEVEGDEDFTVTIVSATDSDGAVAIAPAAGTATVTINDNDVPALIAIADAGETVETGDTGTDTTLSFAVTTDASFSGDLTLTYSLDGGATTPTQLVTFINGAGTLDIAVANDDVDNGTETVDVILVGVDDAQFAIDGTAATANGSVSEDDTGVVSSDFAPGGDLDGDEVANNVDPDIDGDGIGNETDVFFFDSAIDADGHGTPLADGQTIRLDFDVAGTPFENGLTGVMQGTAGGAYDKETGAGMVQNGQLQVTTTTGDTGGSNDPQNDYHFGIQRGSGFTVETMMDNPFVGGFSGGFSQAGIAISIDSLDFVKLVFGTSSEVEFSVRDANVETKAPTDGGFPPGVEFTTFDKIKLEIEVNVDNTGDATSVGTLTFLDDQGAPLAGVPTKTLNLDLGGAVETALADPNVPVGVGVTHTHGGGGTPFVASYDYLEVKADGGVVDPGDPSDVLAILNDQNDIVTDQTYADGTNGSAVLRIMQGNNNVESSNFGANSFEVENTGDKKISAIFIDVRDALYGDSVFDPNGQGGDTSPRPGPSTRTAVPAGSSRGRDTSYPAPIRFPTRRARGLPAMVGSKARW